MSDRPGAMTGPQHWAEAERLLASADMADPSEAFVGDPVAAAQVHATLALTAATLEAGGRPVRSAWRQLGIGP